MIKFEYLTTPITCGIMSLYGGEIESIGRREWWGVKAQERRQKLFGKATGKTRRQYPPPPLKQRKSQ